MVAGGARRDAGDADTPQLGHRIVSPSRMTTERRSPARPAGGYVTLPAFDETGYVVLDQYDQSRDPADWLDLEYVDWMSSGETRFAPLASAYGEIECNAFFNHAPAKTDKDGVWVKANAARAPHLVARAVEPGANIGRCRVIELQPTGYVDAIRNLHLDDNNYLNPKGTGWIVRGFFNLSDDAGSALILREDRTDAATETRIPLPAGAQVIVDTQRLWHAVFHAGSAPRYCLITSWESGPALGAFIDKYRGRSTIDSLPVSDDMIVAAKAAIDQQKWQRRAERLRWELRRVRRLIARLNGGRD
jgi:hypothetical protein